MLGAYIIVISSSWIDPLIIMQCPSLSLVTFFILLFKIFIYLFLSALGLHCCAWAFSSCSEGGYFSLWCTGFHCGGFSCCGSWALGVQASVVVACGLQQLWLTGSRVQAQQLWHLGLVALWHVGSSWTRARTHVPCTGRRIINHCATREALFFKVYFI